MSNYVPDRVLARRLREYDPNLFLEWNVEHERWMLMCRHADGEPRLISVIQNPDRSYRPADDRILAQVWAADICARHGSPAEFMKVLDEKNHALEASQKAIVKDQLSQVAREDLYRAFFGGTQIQAGIDL